MPYPQRRLVPVITAHDAALAFINRADRTGTIRWRRYGSWGDPEVYDRARSLEVLAPLKPFLMYPDGGRQGLWLPGWDQRSVWGFHPPFDAYFAHLWRNPASRDAEPDIGIYGRATIAGRPYAVTTSRSLAHEIATATGADLAAVVRAMLGID